MADSAALKGRSTEKAAQSNTNKMAGWLLSPYEATTWNYKYAVDGWGASAFTVNWEYKYSLSDPVWSYWVDTAKSFIADRMKGLKSRPIRTSSLAHYSRNLRAFFEYMHGVCGCCDISEIVKDDVERYTLHVASSGCTISSMEQKLQVVSDLFNYRQYTPIKLMFNPFPGSRYTGIAKQFGRPNGHTKTLKPRELFYLLNEAIGQVKNSAHDLELFEQCMSLRKSHSISSVAYKRRFNESVEDLYRRIRSLYGAALVVVFSLVAERKHESSGRTCDQVEELLKSEIGLLKGWEKKTSGTETGKATKVFVVEEVKMALAVIRKLTSYKRQECKSKKLLLKLPIQHSTKDGCQKEYHLDTASLYRLIDSFQRYVGFKLRLRPHMFRKAYAMLWAWRYEVGDLEGLAQLLKHNNEFTKAYVDDEDIFHFLPDAERKIAFEILNKAFSLNGAVKGAAGKTLERYGRLIQSKSRLLEPHAIADFIDSLLSSGELRIVSHADGYCVFTEDSVEDSRCLDDQGRPSAALREEKKCVGCPNFGMRGGSSSYL
ncbi:MAG: hypothetical protein K6L74_15135 [Neptuniibacter sp.]